MSRWLLVVLGVTGCAALSGLGDLEVGGSDAGSGSDSSSADSSMVAVDGSNPSDGSVVDAADAGCALMGASCGNGNNGARWCCSGLACSSFGTCGPCGSMLSCTSAPDTCCSGTTYCGGGNGDGGMCVACVPSGGACDTSRLCCSHNCATMMGGKGICQ